MVKPAASGKRARGIGARRPYAKSLVSIRLRLPMCRSIRPLFNFEPPATPEEIRAAALQYVRKVSGTRNPTGVNAVAFESAVEQVARATAELVSKLKTEARPKSREHEAEKARARSARRFA